MSENRTQRADRRTAYTLQVIKDAVLCELAKYEYQDLTVAGVCRAAGINRGTFYRHYSNVAEVIDELLTDAVSNMQNVFERFEPTPGEGCSGCPHSLCSFLREHSEYQPLFFSDALHSMVLDRLVSLNYAEAARRTDLTDSEIKTLSYFQLSGCLAVIKRDVGVADGQWRKTQATIDSFIGRGFKAV